MKIALKNDFIAKIRSLKEYEKVYAALWVVSGIKHIVRRENGGAVIELAQRVNAPMNLIHIYDLGYVQALQDLGQPLIFDDELPTSLELLRRGIRALGATVMSKSEAKAHIKMNPLLHRLMSNVTVYTVHAGVPKLYCKAYISPENPVLDLRRLRKPHEFRIVFDKQLLRKLLDECIFIIGPKRNHRVTLGGSQVQEFWVS